MKAETTFNIKLNNRRKDSKNQNNIPASKHFQTPEHIYERDAKFILIEQLKDQSIDKETQTQKAREIFWIKKLKTLHPYGLNKELNYF